MKSMACWMASGVRAQHLGHLAQVPLLQQQQVLIDNAGRERKHLQPDLVQTQRVSGLTFSRSGVGLRSRRRRPLAAQLEMKFTALRLDLHQQAFAQAPRCHADRIEVLHQLHCLGAAKLGGGSHAGASAASAASDPSLAHITR